MSISPMKKLTLLLCGDDVDPVIRKLMYLRCLDISKSDGDDEIGLKAYNGEARVAELQKQLVDIDLAIRSLSKYSTRKKSLFTGRINVKLDDFIADGRYDSAFEIADDVNDKNAFMAVKRNEAARKEEQIKEITPWQNYDIPLNVTGTEYTSFMLGSFPISMKKEQFTAEIIEAGGTVDILGEDTTASYVSIICHKDDEDNVVRTLARLGFIKAVFKEIDKTALEAISEYKKAASDAMAASREYEEEIRKNAEKLDDLEILYDAVSTDLNAAKSKLRLASTENCVLLSGWVPADKEAKVISLFEKYDCAYELNEPAEEDDPPILLKNNEFAKNFEWVLGMYSYPKYGSYDPTFIMGIFYCFIFGVMFADVGYGLILVAACFGAVKLLKPREGMKRFLLMFGYCGISCTAMGILFGGYFSDLPQEIMSGFMGIENPPDFALYFNPLNDPMKLIILSLVIGGVHLVAGMAVKMYVTWRDGHPLDAILDTVPWWILFTGIVLLILAPSIGLWVSIAGVAALILTQGRKQKNIFMKILKGVGSLYGLINFMSDLVSYSRIMALGLASAVLGQVMNILATMLGTSIPGFFFMIIVFIVGHTLNIALNVLGSFVHTSRLQYIEFFSKFFEEGGRAFEPVIPADQYTIDNNNI